MNEPITELLGAAKALRHWLRNSLNAGPPLHRNVTRENQIYCALWDAVANAELYIEQEQAGNQPQKVSETEALCDWKRRYEDERAIVDRCWRALGISTYEEAKGKTIDEIIAAQAAALKKIGNDQITARKQFKAWSDYGLWRACQELARSVLP